MCCFLQSYRRDELGDFTTDRSILTTSSRSRPVEYSDFLEMTFPTSFLAL